MAPDLTNNLSKLLNFFKMAFYFFSLASVFAICVLMPVNYYVRHNVSFQANSFAHLHVQNNIGLFDDDDDKGEYAPPDTKPPPKNQPGSGDWIDLLGGANSIQTLHLLFTYLFSFLAIRFIYINYMRFIRSRQLFSLELAHSIAARTVMVTDLPNHLQGDQALAVYFENMDLPVESVSLCRELGSLEALIHRRTKLLLKLESAWTKYVGNPSAVEQYDPSLNIPADPSTQRLVDIGDEESQSSKLVVPHRPRPTLRPTWFGRKVDALEYLGAQFQEADEAFRKKRRAARLDPTTSAFVTFETMSSAVSLSLL